VSDPSHGSDRMVGMLDRAVRAIALYGGGIVIFALVVLTVIDVTLRSVFNSPIYGARDFGSIMLLIVVALSVAYSGRTGGQVAVELFVNMAGPRVTRWIDTLMRLIGAVMIGVLAWQLVITGLEATIFGERTTTLLISYEPFFYVLAFGMALYGLVLVVEIIRLVGGHDIDDAPKD
jgi:TRAP-type C4-dicarboxylate transport system permease small subunit